MDELTFVQNGKNGVDLVPSERNVNVLGPVRVDKPTILKKVDEFLSDMVRERMISMNADDLIRKQLERRVEVATKNACGVIDSEVQRVVKQLVMKTAAKIVSEMQITATVVVERRTNAAS